MCFSATVSFAVAAGTSVAGVLAISKASHWREIPLAAIPLLFATQQLVEGWLWLSVTSQGDVAVIGRLANLFIFFAMVLWPVWMPFAVGLVEPEHPRRLALIVPFALALWVSCMNLSDIWTHPYNVGIIRKNLSYGNGTLYSAIDYAAYAVCTCCPALLASDKLLRLFGAIITIGLIVSVAVHFAAFISIWCFFAAAGSVTLYLYFVTLTKPIAVRRLA